MPRRTHGQVGKYLHGMRHPGDNASPFQWTNANA